MAFQNLVRRTQTSAIVGQITYDGPLRAEPVILRSTSEANNVIGRAFRHVADLDRVVTADGIGVFAGILSNTLLYATSGPASGTLDPTITLPNEMEAQVLSMGIIMVDLSQDSPTASSRSIGASVWYENATGILVGVESATTTVTDYTKVPNAVISRNNVDAVPGLAIITLTN